MNVGTNHSEPSYINIAQDVNALEKNIEDCPFSSLTRYLLLREYRKTGHADFEKVLKKTTLYFNNHHWLQFQLSQIGTETAGFKNGLHESKIEHEIQNDFAVARHEGLEISPNSDSYLLKEDSHLPDTQSLGLHIENYYENGKPSEDENVTWHKEDFIPDSQTLGTHIESPEETGEQGIVENVYDEIAHESETDIPHTQTLGTHFESSPQTEAENEHDNNNTEVHEEDASLPETQSLGFHTEASGIEPGFNNEVVQENIQEENDTGLQRIEQNAEDANHREPFENTPGEVVPDQLTVLENTDATGEGPLAFEPLHTVDYFASQGIRITDEALTNDKLGTQMKSFTEWLKSMKKLHASKLPEDNSLAEDIIQSAAEVSNIDTEVLTEAMAEVLIKQDKKEKAIEMYNKLSLINPSKSAYFAAKIESIKST